MALKHVVGYETHDGRVRVTSQAVCLDFFVLGIFFKMCKKKDCLFTVAWKEPFFHRRDFLTAAAS